MGDEEDRKLFVGGLPQEASQDDLQVRIKILSWDLLYCGWILKSFCSGIFWEVWRVRLGQAKDGPYDW